MHVLKIVDHNYTNNLPKWPFIDEGEILTLVVAVGTFMVQQATKTVFPLHYLEQRGEVSSSTILLHTMAFTNICMYCHKVRYTLKSR